MTKQNSPAFIALFGTATLVVSYTGAQASSGATAPAEARDADIVVTATVPPDPMMGNIPLQNQLSQAQIADYGVPTVADLLDELASQLEIEPGRIASGPLVLVNGRQISSVHEVGDLPTESVLRVDIFPEEVALRYGYSADQKVVNIILRPLFRSAAVNVGAGFATNGGGQNGNGDIAITRISGNDRLSITAGVRTFRSLLESQREIRPPGSGTPFDLVGNVIAAPGSASEEIDPNLSALAGMPVTVAGVPAGIANPVLADFASTANMANVSDLGRYRTLRPASHEYWVNAVIARQIAHNVTASFNARGDYNSNRSLNGLGGVTLLLPQTNPYSPFSMDVAIARYLGDAMEQRTRSATGHLGFSINADVDRWWLSLTGIYDHSETRTGTDRGIDVSMIQSSLAAGDPSVNPFAPLAGSFVKTQRDRALSKFDSGGIQLVAIGSPFKLPAGGVRTSVRIGANRIGLLARSIQPDSSQSKELSRSDESAWFSIDLPIASRREKVLSPIGDLSANFNLGLNHISNLGTLWRTGYGLYSTPRDGISLVASISDDRRAPNIQQLGSPIIETRGARVFDFVRGETVEISTLIGGNPALVPDHRHTFKLGLNLAPFSASKLRMGADYLRTRTRNAIAGLPPASAAIQAAFPERFIRDADGTLVQIDSRPVNFARENREQLRWGVDFTHVFGARREPRPRSNGRGSPNQNSSGVPHDGRDGGGDVASGGTAVAGDDATDEGNPNGDRARFRFSFYHSWIFRDEILVRSGAPVIDLLDGAAAGTGGGRPRHRLQFDIGITDRGLGARVNGIWRSGTIVRAGQNSATGDLHFSPLATINLRLFADAGQRLPAKAWAQGLRLSLSIANVLNDRQQVRDRGGETPVSFQPAYIDPLGRTISIGIRKILF